MNTTLVIMAAGIGSRFGGGVKQLTPVGPNGEIIIDYSIHDALEAGFNKIVFIIRKDIEKDFREVIGDRIEKICDVEYVFQSLDDLPEGFEKPADRTKPWGTGQAVRCCKGVVNEPFAVINADDYYGSKAYQLIYDYLTTHPDDSTYRYAMVGYILENTLTENGHVARGVCVTDEHGVLQTIHERTHIEKRGAITAYTEDDGATWNEIPAGSIVSMNMWGFQKSLMEELKKGFPEFLKENLDKNPLKCEYFLPFAVDDLIQEGKATVQVLKTDDKWYGVTYKEDKAFVVKAIQSLKDSGLYPQELWEEQ